jgi:hypothetical protein
MLRQQGGLLAVAAMAVVFSLGCEDQQAGAPAAGGGAAGEAPPEKRIDEAGDKIMASDKKAEARQWLKDDNHVLFKFREGKAGLAKIVDEFYVAGAEKIYVGDISTEAGKDFAGTILVVLPEDFAARTKLFKIDERVGPEFQEDPVADRGQKYLYYSLD